MTEKSIETDSLNDHPERKHPIHGIEYHLGKQTIIFDTVCTFQRQSYLANHEVHSLLRDIWRNAKGWCVTSYIIMPDHIHYFACHRDASVEYESWVRYWKRAFTKRFTKPSHKWQSDHWETRIRSKKHFHEKLEYMNMNPVRKKLVSHSDDWEFKGEIFDFIY